MQILIFTSNTCLVADPDKVLVGELNERNNMITHLSSQLEANVTLLLIWTRLTTITSGLTYISTVRLSGLIYWLKNTPLFYL